MLSIQIEKKLPHFKVEVDMEINDEIAILFGPSGSGKTTILNCLAGLTNPDQGAIANNGDVYFSHEQKPLAVQKRKIGYLFQDYALFPHMTVKKNIYYGMKNYELTEQIIEVLGIKHLLNKYPLEISGGEKQRVALTRALATEPSILLLDEPFSALDQETRQQCQDELIRLHDLWNIPVLMVTHDLDEAKKLGDRIFFIKEGKIEKVVLA
ncbi:ATP-binding cassette domain-containing protein [Calidifontibacillus oryziterrae]|uniref:ATP-binding cassette domain-containing protein n=1 Tax=Calidifontibacillus oryziterrae TaxID=1191699 RepID=UPI0002FCD15C|nr:ATP-binding cassette domain-containing protein [Calidifontibacillus oryziterrae]